MSSDNRDQPVAKVHSADYSERTDIGQLHASVVRERQEPSDGNEPISLWMMTFLMATVAFGGFYLAMFSGGFRADVLDHRQGVGFGGGSAGGGEAGAVPVELTLAQKGEKVFKQNCVACHGAGGAGQPGVFPTLHGTTWVVGSEKRLAGILLHGLQGPIDVNGTIYNGAMPAWGAQLSDEQIAAVTTYIRSSWGNNAPEITPEKIAAARQIFADRTTPWTAEELLAIPEDATLPAGDAAPPADATPADGTNPAPPAGSPDLAPPADATSPSAA